ncbi:hypothetical protein HZB88_00325 [archaeon]|nr:hypothetical protein [archaeon]
MLISFFEEFPTKKNLEKINLVNWPTKIYIAAKSLEQFNKIKTEIRAKNIKEFVYWPILEINEGYWISPFAKRSALKRIFKELKNTKTSVMLDLELPTTKNPKLYLTQFFNFPRNKSLIKKFIRNYQGTIYLAEYYPEGKRKEKILQFLGLHYKSDKAKIIKMVYHSIHHFNKEFISNEIKNGKKEFGKNFIVAYGTIAHGIGRWEPKLSPPQLKEDLRIAKEIGIEEAIIFRLGGLDRNYLKILSSFSL